MRFYALAQRPWIEEDPGSESGAGGDGYWGLPPGTIGSVDLSAVGARNRVFVTSEQPFTVGGDILAAFGDGARIDRLALSGRARNDWNNVLGVSVANGTVLLDALWDILTIHADSDGATRTKPLMPTHRGVLELHLGGHSLLRAEKLPEDPTLHPAWPVMQRVLRNDYRAIQSRDETVARKWLGAQRIKLRLSEGRVSELLIDDDLERVAPLEPTTTITDDFNRADQSGLGTSAEGWSWTTVSGTTFIDDNNARVGTNSGARAEFDLSSDDQRVLSALLSAAGTNKAGEACRFSPSADTCYVVGIQGNNDLLRLTRIVDGSRSILDSMTATWSSGDTVAVVIDGSSLSAEINGATVLGPLTDTQITGNLRTGYNASGGGGSGSSRHDDYVASDLVEGGDDLVRVVAEAIGAEEQRSRLVAVTRLKSDEVGVGHALQRARSRSRWLVETNGIGEATVSVIEAIGAELLRVVSEAVAATEAVARALGLTRRRHEALGLAETVRSAREMVRLRSEAATVSETTASVIDAIIAAVVRVVSEVIAMAETARRPRHRARSRGETVGLATAVVQVGGILGAAPAAIANRARMVVRAARRLIDRAAIRFNVPPARR